MGTAERRREIIKILCRRQHETMSNLASELGVSTRTIQRDIDILSLSEPIYTQSGKYNGGVYIVEGYSLDQMFMTETELQVLNKLYITSIDTTTLLTMDERKILHEIISQYSKPQTYKRKD